jgi:hypothetical protein
MSLVVKIVSFGATQKMSRIDAVNATAYPPVSRWMPLGLPVVPEV